MRILFAFVLCTAGLYSQDTLKTLIGQEYTGEVIGISETTVDFKNSENARIQKVNLNMVAQISLSNGEKLYEHNIPPVDISNAGYIESEVGHKNQFDIVDKEKFDSKMATAQYSALYLEERQAIALESIAKSNKRIATILFFAFLSWTITANI